MFINYHLIVFADLVRDRKTLLQVGMSAIITITLNLFVNFGYIIYNSVISSYK